jgi:hypothetical protein
VNSSGSTSFAAVRIVPSGQGPSRRAWPISRPEWRADLFYTEVQQPAIERHAIAAIAIANEKISVALAPSAAFDNFAIAQGSPGIFV